MTWVTETLHRPQGHGCVLTRPAGNNSRTKAQPPLFTITRKRKVLGRTKRCHSLILLWLYRPSFIFISSIEFVWACADHASFWRVVSTAVAWLNLVRAPPGFHPCTLPERWHICCDRATTLRFVGSYMGGGLVVSVRVNRPGVCQYITATLPDVKGQATFVFVYITFQNKPQTDPSFF